MIGDKSFRRMIKNIRKHIPDAIIAYRVIELVSKQRAEISQLRSQIKYIHTGKQFKQTDWEKFNEDYYK